MGQDQIISKGADGRVPRHLHLGVLWHRVERVSYCQPPESEGSYFLQASVSDWRSRRVVPLTVLWLGCRCPVGSPGSRRYLWRPHQPCSHNLSGNIPRVLLAQSSDLLSSSTVGGLCRRMCRSGQLLRIGKQIRRRLWSPNFRTGHLVCRRLLHRSAGLDEQHRQVFPIAVESPLTQQEHSGMR